MQYGVSHIYDNIGRHLITILKQRLKCLREQYQMALNRPQNLQPPHHHLKQSQHGYIIDINKKNPRSNPPKLSQYTLPNATLNALQTPFMSHTRILVTCDMPYHTQTISLSIFSGMECLCQQEQHSNTNGKGIDMPTHILKTKPNKSSIGQDLQPKPIQTQLQYS